MYEWCLWLVQQMLSIIVVSAKELGDHRIIYHTQHDTHTAESTAVLLWIKDTQISLQNGRCVFVNPFSKKVANMFSTFQNIFKVFF